MTGLPHLGEVLRANARLCPDRVGARDLERAMTFRQWNERACRFANALLGLGLGKGDRVAVLAYNRVEWLEIYAAAAKAGVVAVPVNFRLVGAEIRYIVENCEAAAWANGEASLVTRQTGKAMPICPAMAHARRGGPSGDAGEHGDGADNRRATLHAAVGDVFKIVGRRSVSEQCGLNCRDHHSMHAKWAGDE
jgi:acyl-coenzyme A synthetase/AMP-(fatty) acid ligase